MQPSPVPVGTWMPWHPAHAQAQSSARATPDSPQLAQARATIVPTPSPGGELPTSHPAKVLTDYLGALRRRFALVILVAMLVITPGAILVLRMPDQYRATAQILIEAPRADSLLEMVITNVANGSSSEGQRQYVANVVARIQNQETAWQVATDPYFRDPEVDPAQTVLEIRKNLQVAVLPGGTTYYDVTLKGKDPKRVTELLRRLLEKDQNWEKNDQTSALQNVQQQVDSQLTTLRGELVSTERQIQELMDRGSIQMAPGGGNLYAQLYAQLIPQIANSQAELAAMTRQAIIEQAAPQLVADARTNRIQENLDQYLQYRQQILMAIQRARRTVRNSSDSYFGTMQEELQRVNDFIARLEAQIPDQSTSQVEQARSQVMKELQRKVDHLSDQADDNLLAYQNALPDLQLFETLQDRRDRQNQQIEVAEKKKQEFAMLYANLSSQEPITFESKPSVPTDPFAPNRPLMIAVLSVLGMALGCGLVCGLEHFDHRVTIPEPVVNGTGLPLLGVVGRIARTSRLERGGHLWTPAVTQGEDADAYRNLRASLIGDPSPVSILVTSARVGEGKSTTALNLAATCARAGERTLLIDVDLRRASLAPVFLSERTGNRSEGTTKTTEGDDQVDHPSHQLGLTDALQGRNPWQACLVKTEIPLLEFLPTGPTAEVPIELLGTLEMRQLIQSVSQHYDRVILDGPAVLGLADCRMLGRLVDGAILVIRSGYGSLKPLARACHLLSQSQVTILGSVFNGLQRDRTNWSSYAEGIEDRTGQHWLDPSHTATSTRGRPLAAA